MCAEQRPKLDVRYFITNWRQPLPLRVKVAKLAQNLWIRLSTPANCCGHPGEPGC